MLEAFRKSGNKPEWMILDVIPVLPPELRPLVPLDGGRFATSDLERSLSPGHQPQQPAEEADGTARAGRHRAQRKAHAAGSCGRAVRQRPPRPRAARHQQPPAEVALSDTLKGKQGRFRQNLLGKRVDYSGRSVIVVGPELKLNQCGLPKKMALELFKPFIYHKLEAAGSLHDHQAGQGNGRAAGAGGLGHPRRRHPRASGPAEPRSRRCTAWVFRRSNRCWSKAKPSAFTRWSAPRSTRDFDGDQMAVHIPLSPESQVEASVLMLSSRNILSPAHGLPLAVPSQDMVLGIYYLTKSKPGAKGEGRVFGGSDEVVLALEAGEVELLTPDPLALHRRSD